MQLRPGMRLESATSDTEVVVVKVPTGTDLDIRCGGIAMVEPGTADKVPATVEGEPTLTGKRYASEELGLELLCSKGGGGALSVGDEPLLVKGAKPLPSSD